MKKNGRPPPTRTISALSGFTRRSIGQRDGRNGSSNKVGRPNRMSATSAGASGDAPMARIDSANPAQISTVSTIAAYPISGLVWVASRPARPPVPAVNVEPRMSSSSISE
ncbi:hypothetical protein MMB19_10545 [Ralstonia insidiosa]|nr:hypothetical protein MMB19_10545 [Ralstonia insidiosa]